MVTPVDPLHRLQFDLQSRSHCCRILIPQLRNPAQTQEPSPSIDLFFPMRCIIAIAQSWQIVQSNDCQATGHYRTKKKLIAAALPLEAINKESTREKWIRHRRPPALRSGVLR